MHTTTRSVTAALLCQLEGLVPVRPTRCRSQTDDNRTAAGRHAQLPSTRRSKPRSHGPSRRSVQSMVAALLVTGLVGCGSTRDGEGEPGGEEAPVASADTPMETQEVSQQPDAATDTEEESPADPGAVTDEPEEPDDREAVEIDSVPWPEDLDGAQALFDRMPAELAGMSLQRPDFYGPSAGVFYGEDATGVTAYVMGTDADLQDPAANLAVMFGMGMVCMDGTYAGTAPQSQWGGGPDIPEGGASGPDAELWWFSCDFEDAESMPYAGHAIGWVSGELAWLVTAPDEDTTEMTVAALRDALG